MQGFGTDRNTLIINLAIRIIPLFTLFIIWNGEFGIKPYAGERYLNSNKFTCILGFLIIFGLPFLKTNLNFKYISNTLGNLVFWVPMFHSAIAYGERKSYINYGYWISIIIVFVCFILQSVMIYKEKSIKK